MADIVKAKGIITFAPHEKAPSFVLGTIVINLDELFDYVGGEGKQYLSDYKGAKQLKLQVTSMKDKRGIMVQVDTYKKESTGTTTRNGITTSDEPDLPF